MVERITGDLPVATSNSVLGLTRYGYLPAPLGRQRAAGGNETDINATAEGVEPVPTGRGPAYLI